MAMIGVFDYFDVLAGLAQPDFHIAFSFHAIQLESVPFFRPKRWIIPL